MIQIDQHGRNVHHMPISNRAVTNKQLRVAIDTRVGMIQLCSLAEGRKRYGGFLWHNWREPNPCRPSACLCHWAQGHSVASKGQSQKIAISGLFWPPLSEAFKMPHCGIVLSGEGRQRACIGQDLFNDVTGIPHTTRTLLQDRTVESRQP